MVKKGLGWLLREWTRDHPAGASLSYEIRATTPRLVLRNGVRKSLGCR